MKILKLNNNSEDIELIPKQFLQIILSYYSIGVSKNLWKNYSIQIGNASKNKHTNIVFYKKNFSYPIISIKHFRSNNKKYIEIDNNIKKTNISNINEINFWFKSYFLDKAKI